MILLLIKIAEWIDLCASNENAEGQAGWIIILALLLINYLGYYADFNSFIGLIFNMIVYQMFNEKAKHEEYVLNQKWKERFGSGSDDIELSTSIKPKDIAFSKLRAFRWRNPKLSHISDKKIIAHFRNRFSSLSMKSDVQILRFIEQKFKINSKNYITCDSCAFWKPRLVSKSGFCTKNKIISWRSFTCYLGEKKKTVRNFSDVLRSNQDLIMLFLVILILIAIFILPALYY